MSNTRHIKSGIGLRAPHVQELLSRKPDLGFLEAHSENYFGGGQPLKSLRTLASIYPISLHGVGLSLGRADGLDHRHLHELKTLIDEIHPIFVSEHLTWSGYQHMYVPDLLPVPYTHEAIDIFSDHIMEFQDKIGRQILIENPSNYIAFEKIDYNETDFINTLVDQTGCGLLLDINNIMVSSRNLEYDPYQYIDEIVSDGRVKQFHLAGYHIQTLDTGENILIDTHSKPVYPEVWQLYQHAVRRFGNVATLIEWDADIPALDALLDEAAKADHLGDAARKGIHGQAA